MDNGVRLIVRLSDLKDLLQSKWFHDSLMSSAQTFTWQTAAPIESLLLLFLCSAGSYWPFSSAKTWVQPPLLWAVVPRLAGTPHTLAVSRAVPLLAALWECWAATAGTDTCSHSGPPWGSPSMLFFFLLPRIFLLPLPCRAQAQFAFEPLRKEMSKGCLCECLLQIKNTLSQIRV